MLFQLFLHQWMAQVKIAQFFKLANLYSCRSLVYFPDQFPTVDFIVAPLKSKVVISVFQFFTFAFILASTSALSILTDVYMVDDFPQADYLLHQPRPLHHLDYPTIMELKPKIKHIVYGLGLEAHFEHWGF